LDDGVSDKISLLLRFSRDHTPKTFHVPSCTSTCFGAPFWIKIVDTRPWVYDTKICNRFEHENQSNLSGVVTTVSPFPSCRTLREGIHE
jgi:hypothetical protein